MQDHGYETRQMYIQDYAARIKLRPEEQRALWMDYLKAIKHPRMEPQIRNDNVPRYRVVQSGQTLVEEVLPGPGPAALIASKLEQERSMLDVMKKLHDDLTDRETWKAI